MLGVRHGSLEWDYRLWVVRAISTRRNEEGGTLTHSKSGERERERLKTQREIERESKSTSSLD